MTDSTYELPRVLVSPDLCETAPMTDEQALLEAHRRGWTSPWVFEECPELDFLGPRYTVGDRIFNLRGAAEESFDAAFIDADRLACSVPSDEAPMAPMRDYSRTLVRPPEPAEPKKGEATMNDAAGSVQQPEAASLYRALRMLHPITRSCVACAANSGLIQDIVDGALGLFPESEVPMTDAQALLKAQSIWGPTISLIRETSAGFWVKEAFIAMLWTADKASAEVVASSYRHSSCNDKPASWEAMFASVQDGAKC